MFEMDINNINMLLKIYRQYKWYIYLYTYYIVDDVYIHINKRYKYLYLYRLLILGWMVYLIYTIRRNLPSQWWIEYAIENNL